MADTTSVYNDQIEAFLTENGIPYSVSNYGSPMILVDRTGMCCAAMTQSAKNESEHYVIVKNAISAILPKNVWVMWGGRTDDWLGIEVWCKS